MKKYLLIAAAVLVMAACAKTDKTTTGEEAKEYLETYMDTFYPGVLPNVNGIYILEDEPGTGDLWNPEIAYIYAGSTIRTLGGTISSTTDKVLSQQLGTFETGNYYGPKYSATGEGSSYAGVDALLTGMRQGGTRTAIIPSWLLTTSRYDKAEDYLKNCSSSTHLMYTISLSGQCADMAVAEKDSLQRYVNRHFGPDKASVHVPGSENQYDGMFYFVSDTTAFEGVDQRKEDGTYKLNYTGRLLNGQVFDTTDEIVAKDAGIYKASKTYEPVSISFSSTVSSISLDGSTSLVKGFQSGLYKLHWRGQKATILFTSTLGYDTSGSGNAIPGYSPLIFELELL